MIAPERVMDVNLPEGYQARPARLEDLPAVVEMWNAWARQVMGVKMFWVERTETEWREPGFVLERDTRLAIAPDGQIAGYYEVMDRFEPHVRPQCWGLTHPDHQTVRTGLLAWAEQRARQSVPLAPDGARVVLLAATQSADVLAVQICQEQGFELKRYGLRMVIDLDAPPVEPELPPGIIIRPFDPQRELRAVVETVRESFQDHWGHVEIPFEDELAAWEHFTQTDKVAFKPELWLVAMDGAEMAGISLCYARTDDDPNLGWVGTLGVRRPWRRMGLGMALLQHSFGLLYRRGQRRVGLGVDAQNLTGATRLYVKAGMHPDPQHEWTFLEKELRPGIDLSTQHV